MTLNEQQRKFAYFFGKLLMWAFENGYEVVIGEVLRTEAQQKIYLQEGKSKTLDSDHLKKCAGDVLLFKTPTSGYGYITDSTAYKPLGDYWKSLHPNCRWGGDFKNLADGNHFEFHVS